MPAYVIVGVDVLDQEAGLAYAAVAQPSILSHGGRYLVAGPTPAPVEGAWDSDRLLVIEFPDMDRIREWYDSPEYRRARELRKDAARVRMLFAEGSPAEGFSLPT
ncbi:DUF1330 domain-containing protein [Streptomyces hainanensis]|uniref:DUF1330 domain-containing protein n=1 Tax=Streptomyces hainanensis TaxID=402648 RepID=A0A4R4TLX4_9ACTN|nr:DUF1330 domain-containing protein [Streptomyces hainanensis]TDC76814.1 DUF1330 domain-containing protein [Streptomyces hainanensis]